MEKYPSGGKIVSFWPQPHTIINIYLWHPKCPFERVAVKGRNYFHLVTFPEACTLKTLDSFLQSTTWTPSSGCGPALCCFLLLLHHQVKKGLRLWKLCVYDSLLALWGARAVSTNTGGIWTSWRGLFPSFSA